MMNLRDVLIAGDYLVVEDSNVNGHPVKRSFGPGPYEAIQEYFRMFPQDYEHDFEREQKFGFSFAPNGFLRRL
jgi:cephalosporin hydroxylase